MKAEALIYQPAKDKQEEKKEKITDQELKKFLKKLPKSIAEQFLHSSDKVKVLFVQNKEQEKKKIEVINMGTGERKKANLEEIFGFINDEELLKEEEQLVDSLSPDEKECYMQAEILNYLYEVDCYEMLRNSSEVELKKQLSEILELLWSNRGKRGEQVNIFNADYYKEYFAEKKKYLSLIESTKIKLEELHESIKKTKKQKNLTTNKKKQYKELSNQLRILEKEFKSFQIRNKDSVIHHNREKREKAEKLITAKVNFVVEYMTSEDLALLVLENLEKTLKRKKYWKKEEEDRVLQVINRTVEEWVNKHQGEEAMYSEKNKKRKKTVLRDIQKPLVDYFYRCWASYLSKLNEESGADMTAEIVGMSNSLTILEKQVKN